MAGLLFNVWLQKYAHPYLTWIRRGLSFSQLHLITVQSMRRALVASLRFRFRFQLGMSVGLPYRAMAARGDCW